MLKNILNLKGAQQLNKSEQNAIHGGEKSSNNCTNNCSSNSDCSFGEQCLVVLYPCFIHITRCRTPR